jgi:hypothetical protein
MTIALHHSRARGTAKLVLLGIANHDGDGGAWPSIDTLAKYAGVTTRNVQKALVQLVELGEIAIFQNNGGDRNTRDDHRPNLYHFLLNCPPECDRTKNHRVPRLRQSRDVASDTPPSHGVSLATPRGVASDAHGVSHPTPEPSLEPPLNQLPTVDRERSLSNAKANPPDSSNGVRDERSQSWRAAPPPPSPPGRRAAPPPAVRLPDDPNQAEINRRGRAAARAVLEAKRQQKREHAGSTT